MNRRGQTAHEFLTMYGWSALLALLVLTIIFYFGIVNPDALRPAICAFPEQSGISCLRTSAGTDGTLTLFLENDGQASLLAAASCSYTGAHEQVTTSTVTANGKALDGLAWGNKEFLTLTCRFDGDNPFEGQTGRKRDADVKLKLLDSDGVLYTIKGRVRTYVEATQ